MQELLDKVTYQQMLFAKEKKEFKKHCVYTWGLISILLTVIACLLEPISHMMWLGPLSTAVVLGFISWSVDYIPNEVFDTIRATIIKAAQDNTSLMRTRVLIRKDIRDFKKKYSDDKLHFRHLYKHLYRERFSVGHIPTPEPLAVPTNVRLAE